MIPISGIFYANCVSPTNIFTIRGVRARGQFGFSVFINRSQQDVFDFLSNPGNLSKWNSSFESAEWATSDAPEVGSTYRASSRLLGSKKEGLFEIVRWDRPNLYSYKINTRVFPIEHLESTIRLEQMDNGTQVTSNPGLKSPAC